MTPGQQLRAIREKLGLTLRDVENASARLAAKYGMDDYNLPLSRLSEIETKGVLPSIYRLYTLAVIYRVSVEDILSWFGIDFSRVSADTSVVEPPKSHLLSLRTYQAPVEIPVRIDPGFDVRRTTNIGRMVERWGSVPFAYLRELVGNQYTYGYIGVEDFTMYPLLLPGSFVQIDEARNKVVEAAWRSEYERPIYFVETRDGYTCCWCSIKGIQLILQPHPLSPVQPRVLRDQQEAEIIGQVVGIAMRLGEWAVPDATGKPKALRPVN
jgi:transcriptional regulator with XRE-family HTH domain